MNYNNSGISIANNDKFITSIKDLCESTYSPEVLEGVGGFCSLYQIPNTNTVIAASTDGIGSKLQLAEELQNNYLTTIGQDLVAMVVNDIITCGANPLFFLDYLALHSIKSTEKRLKIIMNSIATACRIAGVALVGGETAELPGLMKESKYYDIAGFGIGLIEKDYIKGAHLVNENDAIIAIESSGPHSNGYSLIRKIFKDYDWSNEQFRDAIMKPTIIYTPLIKSVYKFNSVHAMAHITGGGLEANVSRVLPSFLKADIDYPSITGVFKIIQELGDVSEDEMRKVFNCGIGYVIIVDPSVKNEIINLLNHQGTKSYQIGVIRNK